MKLRPIQCLHHVLFLLLLSLVAGPAWALDPEQPLGGLQIERWYSDEGLPHNTVHGLAQSSDGYLWAATWKGVVRYNGRSFQRFDQADVPAALLGGFRAVLAGGPGELWAASVHDGLYRHQQGHWRHYSEADGLTSANLASLAADGAGGVWVGTRDAGAVHLPASGTARAFDVSSGLADNWVQSFLIEPDGSTWIGSARGLQRLVDGQLLDGAAGLPPRAAVLALLRDRLGRLWAGTDSGLFHYEGGSFRPFATPGVQLRSVSALLEDRDGNLWVGSQSEGLLRIGSRGIERLSAAQGLSNNRITGLLEDSEGSLWVATNAGLNRLSDSAFRTYTRFEGLRDDFVRSISEGREGMWIGTSQGLHLLPTAVAGTGGPQEAPALAGGVERALVQPVGTGLLSSASVMAVLETRDGSVWVGTYDGGLNVLPATERQRPDWPARGRWQVHGRATGMPSDQVRALFESADGSLWVGTTQGVVRFRDGAIVQVLGSKDGLPNSYVLAIGQLRSGAMLFGTVEGFAEWSEQDGARAHPARAALPAGEIFAFLEDAAGILWLGTDAGLVRYDGQRFDRYGRQAGLPDDAVFALLDDRRGHFYLSTNAGLVRLERDSIGSPAGLRSTVLSRADGLAGTQINGSSQPSTWRSRDGHVWLPTARGASELDLDRGLAPSRGLIPVVIEDVRIDGETVHWQSGFSVSPGKRRVSIDYAGLSFRQPGRLRYRYRLIGFDPQWSAPRQQATVDFTNLPPGPYRLEVQAGYDDFEAAATAALEFAVAPRFWQHGWFLPLLGLLLGAAALALHRVRLLGLRRRSLELEQQVRDRTLELQARNEALERSDRDKSALLGTIQLQAQAFARQAREDGLTGLANRRHFDQRLAAEFVRQRAAGRTPVVGLADLDLFKAINDAWSHQAGDDALRAVAAVLERHMQGLGLVARYGGEEFALFFTSLDLAQAQVQAEAIRAEVAALRFHAYPGMQVTLSMGLSARSDALNHEKLLADADHHLYLAKAAGRNRVEIQDTFVAPEG